MLKEILVEKIEQAWQAAAATYQKSFDAIFPAEGAFFSKECGMAGFSSIVGVNGNTALGRRLKEWCAETQKCAISFGRRYRSLDIIHPLQKNVYDKRVQCIVPKIAANRAFLRSLQAQGVNVGDANVEFRLD